MSSPASAKPANHSVQKVIEMFADLGLKVCDDGKAIKAKVEAQRDRRLRDTNSPTESVRETAKRWFQNVEAMQNRRSDLLRVVYEHYVASADTALSVSVVSGVTALTAQLQQHLAALACSACHVDDALAARFVEDYKRDRGLTDGGSLVRPPQLVEGFSAEAALGEIRLTWTCPAQDFDEVEISREELPERSAAGARPAVVVFRGAGARFVDHETAPGVAYLYRAHSWSSGVKSEQAKTARSVCLAEVFHAEARWSGAGVQLSWRLPRADASVLVFKRRDREPEVKFAARGVTPGEGTQAVARGPLKTCTDGAVGEGETWFYRIVCDFGNDRFTPGVVVQIRTPLPPPPPQNLEAIYQQQGKRAAVALEWAAAKSAAALEYVVVRREGSSPPARIADGVNLGATTATQHLDQTIVNGRRYSYAVFSRAGESSRTAAVAPPVDALADVTDLCAECGDGAVQLRWTTPDHVSRVIVRRSLNPMQDHQDGAPVPLLAAGHAKDENLQNGRLYQYLVCCVYRPDGKTEAVSPGVRITAIPERLPEPVSDFGVASQNHEVRCEWTLPDHGQVVVLRSAQPLPFPAGHRLSANEVKNWGSIVAGSKTNSIDPQPDLREPYYSAVTVAGGQAVLGPTATCAVCRDVSRLQHRITRDGVSLRWEWPQNCHSCIVARREGEWPSGPEDERAVRKICSRAEYDAAGQQFLDAMEGAPGHYHYVVYAVATGADRRFYARGVAGGCRTQALWAPWMTVQYSLAPVVKGKMRGRAMQLAWSVEQPLTDFAGVALVADQSEVPSALSQGAELFRWTPHNGDTAGRHEALIDLEPVRRRGWTRFFAKLMTVDPAQASCTLIVHPNVCTAYSDQGRPLRRKPVRGKPHYSPKPPRIVICPKCFEEFPVGKMLFDSYKGGEETTARYGVLDRLLRRAPVPPQNSQRHRLPLKLCPKRHRLPYTAGVQGNLVIGIIGAKFSGKSHFVASLISRLENQTGSDLQAALVPVTDETPVRYKNEFYAPLFEKQVELPMTVGEPEPLIYCLTIDVPSAGKKSMRSVTLALYDTAGENFNSPDLVRRMVQYLRVASGVIFLIDPLQIQAVRDLVPQDITLPNFDQQAQPNEIVGRVLQELEGGKVLDADEPLNIPVAVALTKCDVLRDADLFPSNRLWSADHRHIGFFDDLAHDDMSGMIGEYVRRWDRAVYNTVSQRFSNYAFFGVSATGCASNKKTRRYAHVAPWRVEDPLLWLLAELGVLPRRQSAHRYFS